MAVIVIPVVRIITKGISERSTEEKPAIVETTVVEPTIVESAAMESATAEPATVKPATPAVKATAATVETSGVGGIRLAQRRCAQQSRCDCQSPSYPGPGPTFD